MPSLLESKQVLLNDKKRVEKEVSSLFNNTGKGDTISNIIVNSKIESVETKKARQKLQDILRSEIISKTELKVKDTLTENAIKIMISNHVKVSFREDNGKLEEHFKESNIPTDVQNYLLRSIENVSIFITTIR